MEEIIKEIIINKTKCYFVSPHFDDAILSAGNLISHLAPKTDVTIINVFTKGGQSNTLSARVALRRAGFGSVRSYYSQRVLEDKTVMEKLKIHHENLGFVDSLWRKKSNLNMVVKVLGNFLPEVVHIYPTFRFHMQRGKISSYDKDIVAKVVKRLSIIKNGSIVFCPLAIGNHVDHIIVREACKTLDSKIIFWSDYPYNLRFKEENNKGEKVYFADKSNKKGKLIPMYKTQFGALFPNGVVQSKKEVFYV